MHAYKKHTFSKGKVISVWREKMLYCKTVFPLTLWLIGECPNFLSTIVPKALERRLCALNFVPIQY